MTDNLDNRLEEILHLTAMCDSSMYMVTAICFGILIFELPMRRILGKAPDRIRCRDFIFHLHPFRSQLFTLYSSHTFSFPQQTKLYLHSIFTYDNFYREFFLFLLKLSQGKSLIPHLVQTGTITLSDRSVISQGTIMIYKNST